MQVREVIIKPVFSEKSFKEASIGRYTFIVRKGATKNDVRHAIEKLFKVNVVAVYTNTVKGTATHTTKKGKRVIDASYKKARVTLKKDQKIDMFEMKEDDK